MARPFSRVALAFLVFIAAGGMLLAVVSPSMNSAGQDSPQLNGLGSQLNGLGYGPGPTFVVSGGLHGLPDSGYVSTASGAASGLSSNIFGGTSLAATTAAMSTTTAASSPSTEVVKSSPTGPVASASGFSTETDAANTSRSIEFFSNMTLQVSSASSSLEKITALSYSMGGYVAYSALLKGSAVVVLRVPSRSYQSAVNQVESLGTVLGASSSSNDVTVQYTDLNATLVSLTAEQASLLKLLDQSTNINATLIIESRVQEVNQQVNEVQSQILQTRTLINYATITIDLQELSTPRPLTMKMTATPHSGMAPLSVTFNAIIDGGEAPYVVIYNFGDGTSSQGQSLIHTFVQPGRFNVTVAATDASGNTTEASTILDVSPAPVTSSLGSFPSFVGDLFLRVVEGIIVVAVVVVPIALAIALAVLPLRRRFGLSSKGRGGQP